MQALSFVVNKSKRTVERYLQEDDKDIEKSATSVALSQEQAALRKCYKNFQSLQKVLPEELDTPKRKSLAKKLPGIIRLMNAALEEIKIVEDK